MMSKQDGRERGISAPPEPANDRSRHVRVIHSDGREEIFTADEQEAHERRVQEIVDVISRLSFVQQWEKWESLSADAVEVDVVRQLSAAGAAEAASEAAALCRRARDIEARVNERPRTPPTSWLLELAVMMEDRLAAYATDTAPFTGGE